MVRINEEKCIGCGYCVRDCPVGAMSLSRKKAVVDEALCTECRACIRVCEQGAIEASSQSQPGAVRCEACPVNCMINPGKLGACHRYTNEKGQLKRITRLHTYEDVRDIVGRLPEAPIRRPLITGIGAGTTYPDCKPAPYIVKGKQEGVDVVTVVTEAPLSYSSLLIKIDTDMPVGEEGAGVYVGKTKVGLVTTEQYGSKMLSLGGANLLTGPGGIVVARTIANAANREAIKIRVEGGARLELQIGKAPIIDGNVPASMRVGCGSATMGLFAPLFLKAADEVIVLDSHLTSLMSEHAAGRFAGARPTGVKLRFKMSTPGRYFGDHGKGWGGTSIEDPAEVIEAIDMKVAWPGMKILITETTGSKGAMFEVQDDGTLRSIGLTGAAQEVLSAISSTCEPSRVSALYMGGTGGSARAGVAKHPIKLTQAIHSAKANLTIGGAQPFILPGGGINFLVDVEKVKKGAFYWTPTPATICPVEYTMTLEDYEQMGGHVEVMKPFEAVVPAPVMD